MKSYRILALGMALMALASCGKHATVKGTVEGAAKEKLAVKVLSGSKYDVLDTVKTSASGAFSYKMKMEEGQPEFVYLFRGNTKLASLIVLAGDNVIVEADTLGNYKVSGSEESAKLQQVESDYNEFIRKFSSETDAAAALDDYVKYYRSSVKYLMTNPYSLSVIPVLYHEVSTDYPVFNQVTDALFFKAAGDSLATLYPDSKYIKVLRKDADKRGNLLGLQTQMGVANTSNFPELNMPDINGNKVKLSEIDSKVIIVYFWVAQNEGQKMSNLDFFIPLYKDFHDRGLEIYAVSLDVDKAVWASAVKTQKLPWINVNDGRGSASPSVGLYGIDSVPKAVIIANGEIVSNVPASTEAEFRAFLNKTLK